MNLFKHVPQNDELISTDTVVDECVNGPFVPEIRPPRRCRKEFMPDETTFKHIDEHAMKVIYGTVAKLERSNSPFKFFWTTILIHIELPLNQCDTLFITNTKRHSFVFNAIKF